MKLIARHSWGVIVFLATVIVYVQTMARYIYTEDSAEFITAAATLSIPHPSGYPLFVLLGKVFSYISFVPDIATRINLMTALFAVAAVVVLYYSFEKLWHMPWLAAVLALSFAFSPMPWLQSSYAEVYSLTTLFLAVLFFLYIHYQQEPSNKQLYWFVFMYGLSLTNHLIVLVAAPLVVLWLWREKKPLQHVVFYVKAGGLFLLGLLPYIYIPIRSHQKPAFTWFGGDTLELIEYNIATGYQFSWDVVRYLGDVWQFLYSNLGSVVMIFFVVGLLIMFWKKMSYRYFVTIAFVLFSCGMLLSLSEGQGYSDFASWFYTFLYIPLLIIVLIPVGFFVQDFYTKYPSFVTIIFFIGLIAGYAVYQFPENWRQIDKSHYTFVDEYSQAFFANLPPHAEVYVYHNSLLMDVVIFPLGYQYYVQKIRPDVTVYSTSPVFGLPDDFPIQDLATQNVEIAFNQYIAKRHMNTSRPQCSTYIQKDFFSNGFVYCDAATNDHMAFIPKNTESAIQKNSIFTQSLLAKWYYDKAMQQYQQGQFFSGQRLLIQGIAHDPAVVGQYYQDVVRYRNIILREK